jgi:hypothetical protein
LVNINKLKPYVPYDNITKGLVSKFQRGKREGTTLENKKHWRILWKTKEKIRQIREKVANKRKHKVPYNLFFHEGT